MDEPPRTRNRFEEFAALRKAFCEQNKWLGQGSQATESSAPPAPVWNPPWIRALQEFTDLESTTKAKIEQLAELQQAFLQPKLRSDELEEQMQKTIEARTVDTKRLLEELERMVLTGMAPRDPTNMEEVRISGNAKKHLSTRLKKLIQMFKSGQEYYGNHLKRRQNKLEKYAKFGTEESHERVQRESRAAELLQIGYKDADIQALLLEEARNEQVSKEIKEILDGVQDLHAMFENLHELVVEQGTILDRIDHNVQQSEVGVKKGLEQLKKAQEHQESSCVMA